MHFGLLNQIHFQVLVLPRLLKVDDSHQEIGVKFKIIQSSVSNIYSIWERNLLLWLNHHYNLHGEVLLDSKGKLNSSN